MKAPIQPLNDSDGKPLVFQLNGTRQWASAMTALGFFETLQAAGSPADLHLDRDGENAMVTFRDPDNIQWELFED